MPAELESGAIRHLEDQLLEGAREELAGQQIEVSATTAAPGSSAQGTEGVLIEVSVDADSDELQDRLMEEVYTQFVGESGNLVSGAVQASHERLQSYGSTHSYEVENIQQSFTGVDVRESGDTLTAGYGWEHEAAAFFNRGTSDHTIQGDPVLSWIEEDPSPELRAKFDAEGGGVRVFATESNPSGLPESRFIEAGIDWLESELS